ncbi:MAG TPA: hypothetical protein VHT28_09765 [Silvibacterium sp.]|nr:hypothetical protein [Silvibacterium sp.]
MRLRSLSFVALALSFAAAALPASDHAPPPAKDASTYAAFDAHPDDHVVIAAEPFDTKEKESIFRIDYLKNGFMPIRLIVTNNGDRPISLVDARIHFISAAGDTIPAAEPGDVERRMTHVGNTGRKIPMPAPLPPLGGKAKTPDSKIEQDFSEFEYAAIAVEPHTTRAGFLFYDMQGLGSDPLRGAKLHLKELRDADGKELFYFEILFDKYLSSQR